MIVGSADMRATVRAMVMAELSSADEYDPELLNGYCGTVSREELEKLIWKLKDEGKRRRFLDAFHGGSTVDRIEKLLSELKDKDDRSAYFVCTIACKLPDGREFTVRGISNGTILEKEQGLGGFGYDPLFLCPSLQKTFAELSVEEKHLVSHRGNALRLLKERLSRELEK
jgi:hypothetical protein